MEKLAKYRANIKQIITDYSQYKPSYGDIEVQVIFDEERDHYQLIYVGWHGNRRVRGCVLQIDIDILPTLRLGDNAGFFSQGNPNRSFDRSDVLLLC